MSQNPDKWRSLSKSNTTPSVIWPGLVLFSLAVLALVTLTAGPESGVVTGVLMLATWWFVTKGGKR